MVHVLVTRFFRPTRRHLSECYSLAKLPMNRLSASRLINLALWRQARWRSTLDPSFPSGYCRKRAAKSSEVVAPIEYGADGVGDRAEPIRITFLVAGGAKRVMIRVHCLNRSGSPSVAGGFRFFFVKVN